MNRDDTFTFRTNAIERELITAVAQRLERNQGDAMRYLLREKARELGVIPAAPKDDRHVAQPAT